MHTLCQSQAEPGPRDPQSLKSIVNSTIRLLQSPHLACHYYLVEYNLAVLHMHTHAHMDKHTHTHMLRAAILSLIMNFICAKVNIHALVPVNKPSSFKLQEMSASL